MKNSPYRSFRDLQPGEGAQGNAPPGRCASNSPNRRISLVSPVCSAMLLSAWVMPQANTEAMAHYLQAVSDAVPAGAPRRAGPRACRVAHHGQTAAVCQPVLAAIAGGFTRTQPARAGVTATARPASGKPLLQRLRSDRRRLPRCLACLHALPGAIRSLCSRHWACCLQCRFGADNVMTRDW